ncbi:MAG: hypothetical protein AAFQ80_24460 [Cyanobacteria bacterium J06621_8]
MSLLQLLPKRWFPNAYNPALSKARKKHNSLPKSEHDKFFYLAHINYQQARNIAQQRYTNMAQILRAIIKEHYTLAEQNQVNEIIIFLIDILASKANIFPDMEYANIWYTDHYDLIELAKNMGVGDATLPHWSKELNLHHRYLEITASDLVRILLEIAEEALLEGYQSDADVEGWFSYNAREALKTRKRIARHRQKQSESWFIAYRN